MVLARQTGEKQEMKCRLRGIGLLYSAFCSIDFDRSGHSFQHFGTERISDLPRVTQEAELRNQGPGSLRAELLSAAPASVALWFRNQAPELRPNVQLATVVGDVPQVCRERKRAAQL